MDELRTIRGKTEKNNQNDAVIISKNDLDRIKRYYFGNKTVIFDDLQSYFGCLVVIHGHYLNEIHHESIKYLAFFHFYYIYSFINLK